MQFTMLLLNARICQADIDNCLCAFQDSNINKLLCRHRSGIDSLTAVFKEVGILKI